MQANGEIPACFYYETYNPGNWSFYSSNPPEM